MLSNEAMMPISVDPYVDESGVGYCLRAICANGATLHGLRRLVEIDNIGRFTTKNAKTLCRVLNQSVEWFEISLPTPERTKPSRRDYFGHRWFTRNHLRTQNPQVCTQCIHAKGYCRAIWDVSIATVCVEHQCRLVDSCFQCRKPLRWDRPRIDVGHCGHLMKSEPAELVASELIEFQTFLEDKFHSGNGIRRDHQSYAFSSLKTLSLSGVHSVIASFGFMKKPFEVIHSTIRTKTYGRDEWAEIILRGLIRLDQFEKFMQMNECHSEVIVESLIEHMALNHESVHDQKFALLLLDKIFKRKLNVEFSGPLQRLSQLELF